MEKQTFILAISGGVDSAAMLHMLMAKKTPNITYIAAHYDHGMRSDSSQDMQLVQKLAQMHGLQFETEQENLGSNASEELARSKRYEFLRRIMKKHGAEKIVTAHHQDDVLETMVINILRGTGPRGLMPMLLSSDILRPLLNKTKQELLDYANEHNLEWREDSTNEDEEYLRNYVRKNITPKLEDSKKELLDMRIRLGDIYYEADQLIALATPRMNILHRPTFVGYSFGVQREVVRAWLLKMGVENIDRKMLERIVIGVKTLPIGKKLDIDNSLWLLSTAQNVQIIKKDTP